MKLTLLENACETYSPSICLMALRASPLCRKTMKAKQGWVRAIHRSRMSPNLPKSSLRSLMEVAMARLPTCTRVPTRTPVSCCLSPLTARRLLRSGLEVVGLGEVADGEWEELDEPERERERDGLFMLPQNFTAAASPRG